MYPRKKKDTDPSGNNESQATTSATKDNQPVENRVEPTKKSLHPFVCRLNETAAFDTTSPKSLKGAGFASFCTGMFTIFRPSPIILYFLASHLGLHNPFLKFYIETIIITICVWSGSILFVLFGLGLLLMFSVKIKKKGVLVLHSWGLLLLYFDVFVWLTLAVLLHKESTNFHGLDSHSSTTIDKPLFFFIVIYLESTLYCLGYYVYATYFIAAELTVIDNFY